ncbi:hypothetical protein NDU88_002759 [Pleurodeles waltl]|uniref:Uncharacterized protein n=1 Tax=Pleurodeles waltl TaxID=8319 RepID=A0AAV7Q9T0_PLEWA|nr:hypothetical protein NDU88_002759 [Pleurodeles waltl]
MLRGSRSGPNDKPMAYDFIAQLASDVTVHTTYDVCTPGRLVQFPNVIKGVFAMKAMSIKSYCAQCRVVVRRLCLERHKFWFSLSGHTDVGVQNYVRKKRSSYCYRSGKLALWTSNRAEKLHFISVLYSGAHRQLDTRRILKELL